MKTVDWDAVPEGEDLALMTAEEAVQGLEMKMADFRDTHALYYLPLRAWVGLSRSGLELGTLAPRMKDGLWLVRRDENLCGGNRDIEPIADSIVLRRIV